MEKRIVLFEINGADFLCIPCKFMPNKIKHKLCWVRKTTDNFHNLSLEYEVLCYVESISEAKERAKKFFEYFTT